MIVKEGVRNFSLDKQIYSQIKYQNCRFRRDACVCRRNSARLNPWQSFAIRRAAVRTFGAWIAARVVSDSGADRQGQQAGNRSQAVTQIRALDGMSPDQVSVDIRSVTRRFGRKLALDNLSLSVRRGEKLALLGINGAGKSTLIHILCTILKPDSGQCVINGHDIARSPGAARRNLGVVFQEQSLDTRLTVFENLDFHGRICQVPAALRAQRITDLLDTVELTEHRDALVRTLSPGMRRRVEIARALVHDAAVLILDEPTIGLDTHSRRRIWGYLNRLRAERDLTVIVTTHYIEEVEDCDRVCIIDQGKVHALDTPDAIRATHGREQVRVHPVDAAAAARIAQRFPAAQALADGTLAIVGDGERVMETLLAEFGAEIRNIAFERPSLESAFLNIVGRELDRGDPTPPRKPR